MAKDVLAMQVSSVASESAFSTSGRSITPSRSCLTHFMVEVMMCTKQWMKAGLRLSGESSCITNEQIISEFEYEDKLKRDFDKPQAEEE